MLTMPMQTFPFSLGFGLLLATLATVTGCARPFTAPEPSTSASPTAAVRADVQPAACPKGLDATTTCYRGLDAAGAHVMMAMPKPWNGALIVHAHGGPPLDIKVERADEDLTRWSIWPRAGYAYAASVFRVPGVAVTSAADDTERVRQLFVQRFGKPQRTWLHGQSWGASVAAKTAERHATPHGPYDGVLLSAGVLGGATQSYNFRLDLRVVYQALCNNHPLPDEPTYPLWMGLPSDAKLTREDLRGRINDCLGVDKPAAQRTPAQAAKLKTIVDVIRIPESSVQGHVAWGTWHFQNIVQTLTGGLNPFANDLVRYRGSANDDELNQRVLRYRADSRAVARLAEDADLTGRIPVPVLTVHGTQDATAFVELEAAFRDTMTRGGSESRLVQLYSQDSNHSYLADALYPALLDGLERWVAKGEAPSAASIAQACKSNEARWGVGCRLVPNYAVANLSARVPPR